MAHFINQRIHLLPFTDGFHSLIFDETQVTLESFAFLFIGVTLWSSVHRPKFFTFRLLCYVDRFADFGTAVLRLYFYNV